MSEADKVFAGSIPELYDTYLVPLIPALLLWDGLVSCLRAYSPAELRELIAGIDGHETFDWIVQRVWLYPLPLRGTILIGSPRA